MNMTENTVQDKNQQEVKQHLDNGGMIGSPNKNISNQVGDTLKKNGVVRFYDMNSISSEAYEHNVKSFTRSQNNSRKLFDGTEVTSNKIFLTSGQKTIYNQRMFAFEKDTIFQQMTNKILQLTRQNKIRQQKQALLESIINESRQRYSRESDQENQNIKQIEMILAQTQKLQLQMQNLQSANKNLKKQLAEFRQKHKTLTNALNQSEEVNYKLRLNVQQLSQELMRRPQINISLEQMKAEKDKQLAERDQMISKMEIMKKQYLRAYSRVKQDKEELQLKILDLQEQIQKLEKNKFKSPDRELKTIIEYSEQQIRQSIYRISSASYPTNHVKNLLEKALCGTNQRQTLGYIKSAINYLNSHQIESNVVQEVHELYKSLLSDIESSANRQRKRFQKQFDNLFTKLANQNTNVQYVDFSQPLKQNMTDYGTNTNEKQDIEEINVRSIKSMPISSPKQFNVTQQQGESSARLHEIYNIVYQTLCFLPLHGSQDVLFAPHNINELSKSIEALHQFAKNYEIINSQRHKDCKASIKNLLQIMENIMKNKSSLDKDYLVQIVNEYDFPIFKDQICLALKKLSKETLTRRQSKQIKTKLSSKESEIEQDKNKKVDKSSAFKTPQKLQRSSARISQYEKTPEFNDQLELLRNRMGL